MALLPRRKWHLAIERVLVSTDTISSTFMCQGKRFALSVAARDVQADARLAHEFRHFCDWLRRLGGEDENKNENENDDDDEDFWKALFPTWLTSALAVSLARLVPPPRSRSRSRSRSLPLSLSQTPTEYLKPTTLREYYGEVPTLAFRAVARGGYLRSVHQRDEETGVDTLYPTVPRVKRDAVPCVRVFDDWEAQRAVEEHARDWVAEEREKKKKRKKEKGGYDNMNGGEEWGWEEDVAEQARALFDTHAMLRSRLPAGVPLVPASQLVRAGAPDSAKAVAWTEPHVVRHVGTGGIRGNNKEEEDEKDEVFLFQPARDAKTFLAEVRVHAAIQGLRELGYKFYTGNGLAVRLPRWAGNNDGYGYVDAWEEESEASSESGESFQPESEGDADDEDEKGEENEWGKDDDGDVEMVDAEYTTSGSAMSDSVATRSSQSWSMLFDSGELSDDRGTSDEEEEEEEEDETSSSSSSDSSSNELEDDDGSAPVPASAGTSIITTYLPPTETPMPFHRLFAGRTSRMVGLVYWDRYEPCDCDDKLMGILFAPPGGRPSATVILPEIAALERVWAPERRTRRATWERWVAQVEETVCRLHERGITWGGATAAGENVVVVGYERGMEQGGEGDSGRSQTVIVNFGHGHKHDCPGEEQQQQQQRKEDDLAGLRAMRKRYVGVGGVV